MNAYSLNDPIKYYSDTDIEGTQYTALMNWALDHSDTVMLVYQLSCTSDEFNQNLLSIWDNLSKHRIYTRSVPTEWPGTTACYPDLAEIAEIRKFIPNYTLPDPSLYIDFYTITPEFRQYVLSAGHIRGWLTPNFPEDIAFFTEGKCWFFTTIHEQYYTICGLHPGTREKLESLGIIFDEYQISDKDLWIEPGLLPSTTDSQ